MHFRLWRSAPLSFPLRAGVATLLVAALSGLLAHAALAADDVVTDCSSETQLRAKLAAIEASGGGTLSFNCGTDPAIITLTGGALPPISTNITINGGNRITLSGNNASRLFVVNAGGTLTLNGLTIIKGYSTGDGGAIYNSANGTVNINNSTFRENQSALSGGAIVTYGALNITGVELASNKAVNGGAIYPRFGASVTINGSTLHDNEAVGSNPNGLGGAILAWDGPTVTINASTLHHNKARRGGAVYVLPATTLNGGNGTSFHDNQTTERGGAIFNAGTTNMSSVSVMANTASGGGGIWSEEGMANLTAVVLTGNSTGSAGAGIYSASGTTTITGSTLSGNRAGSAGGGIVVYDGTTTVVDTTISGNSAYNAGGIYNSNGTLNVTNVTLSGNTAGQRGGGLTNQQTATLTNVTLIGNAATEGGGIEQSTLAAGQVLTLKNVVIANSVSGGNCHTFGSSKTPITSAGFNLSSDSTCAAVFTKVGDRNALDPKLGPLAINGGSTATHTHLPMPGSPLIDAGTGSGAPPMDQRGVTRPQGAAVDIGAVEVAADDTRTATPTRTTAPTATGTITPSPTATTGATNRNTYLPLVRR